MVERLDSHAALGVLQILATAGFSPTPDCRFVRHLDSRFPAQDIREWLEHYQQYQGRPVFHKADQVVTFYGLAGNRACFFGVYEVRGHRPAAQGPILANCQWSRHWHDEATLYYELERNRRFDHLRDRVIIDWGRGRNWVQTATNKPVLEIQEPGRRLQPFEDYLEFSLAYDELQLLFAHAEAHRDWKVSLSAVGGVYLILAQDTGEQYVGSAYGEGGIWGRWSDYATTGHGGNALLQKLIQKHKRYPSDFRFSILHVVPKTMSRDEVIRREVLYKVKLGTRATGLNAN